MLAVLDFVHNRYPTSGHSFGSYIMTWRGPKVNHATDHEAASFFNLSDLAFRLEGGGVGLEGPSISEPGKN